MRSSALLYRLRNLELRRAWCRVRPGSSVFFVLGIFPITSFRDGCNYSASISLEKP